MTPMIPDQANTQESVTSPKLPATSANKNRNCQNSTPSNAQSIRSSISISENNASPVLVEKASITQNQDDASRTATALSRTDTSASAGPPFSVFTLNQKRFIIFMASWAGFFSPVSANIYLPALNPLAKSLNVSNTLINLTLTSYMIFQGLAPAFIGSVADSMGRRPAYALCFVIYIAANIGLALQNSYPALIVLRCVQSSGSSATIAMASAVVADVATPAERGGYMGFTLAGSLLGPAIGPVLGGILAEFLGWRAIFWFLTILSGTFLIIFLIFFPETARNTVGNGSIPPKGWNMSLMNYFAVRKARREQHLTDTKSSEQTKTSELPSPKKTRFPNPLASLTIMFDKQVALILLYNALLFAAFYDITATIPSQFASIYKFNDLQIGLCFLPFGSGSMIAALINGQFLDRNFARWCRKTGVQIRKGRDMDLSEFPIERARLEIAIPAVYAVSFLILIWGWVLEINGPLAALLVILFFTSFSMSVAFNVTSTLLIDFFPKRPATVTAASNLTRCLLGAGATAVILPMVNAMGRGWTFTFLSLVLLVTSPIVWLNLTHGMKWREQRRMKDEVALEKKRGRSTEEGRSRLESHDQHNNEQEVMESVGVDQQRFNKELSIARHSGLYRAYSHDHTH